MDPARWDFKIINAIKKEGDLNHDEWETIAKETRQVIPNESSKAMKVHQYNFQGKQFMVKAIKFDISKNNGHPEFTHLNRLIIYS